MAKGGSGTMDGANVQGIQGEVGKYGDGGSLYGQATAQPASRMNVGGALRGALVGGLLSGLPGAIVGGLRGSGALSGLFGPGGAASGGGNFPGGYTSLRDYFDGGGPGRSGDTFQGSPIAGLLNMVGVSPMQGAQPSAPAAGADPTRRASYAAPAAPRSYAPAASPVPVARPVQLPPIMYGQRPIDIAPGSYLDRMQNNPLFYSPLVRNQNLFNVYTGG